MQLATAHPESFSAAIARRMVSQGNREIHVDVPEADLAALRGRAQAWAPGISVSREAVTESLGHQQLMAASIIERQFPGDARLQMIARETANKAMATLPGEEGEDEGGEQIRPRG